LFLNSFTVYKEKELEVNTDWILSVQDLPTNNTLLYFNTFIHYVMIDANRIFIYVDTFS